MKGYIVSILIVGLALGGMGLGTFAWFTDQEEVKNNLIETGNVDLTVQISNFKNDEPYLIVEDLVPSIDTWTPAGYISLQNDGTAPLKWQWYFDKTRGSLDMDKLLFQFLLCESSASSADGGFAVMGHGHGPGPGHGHGPGPGHGSGPGQGSGSGDDEQMPDVLDCYTWSEISNADEIVLNSSVLGSELEPGDPLTFLVSVRLDEDAGNTYANKRARFTAIFDATQTENPGWSETT